MKKIIFAFMALSLLVSCTSTEIVSSWKAPGITISAHQIDKVLFIALVKNETYRREIEDKLVSLSNGKGIASYTFITGSNLTKSDKAMDGFNPINKWTWLDVPFTIIGFWFFPLIIPDIYLKISFRQGFCKKFSLPFTANTVWIYICENVPDILFHPYGVWLFIN